MKEGREKGICRQRKERETLEKDEEYRTREKERDI